MKTLILYDNTGYIYLQMTSSTYRAPQGGINYLEVEIPEGKLITGVDLTVTPNVAVFEDIPQTDIEIADAKIATLELENADINYALMAGGLL